MARAMAAVAEAAGQACAEAGIAPGTVTAAAGGLTGVDWPDEADLVRKALADTLLIPAERIQVVNDCLIALRAATSSPAGCILCAGTGLNCAVRDGRGRVRAGWLLAAALGGYVLADGGLRAGLTAACAASGTLPTRRSVSPRRM